MDVGGSLDVKLEMGIRLGANDREGSKRFGWQGGLTACTVEQSVAGFDSIVYCVGTGLVGDFP